MQLFTHIWWLDFEDATVIGRSGKQTNKNDENCEFDEIRKCRNLLDCEDNSIEVTEYFKD